MNLNLKFEILLGKNNLTHDKLLLLLNHYVMIVNQIAIVCLCFYVLILFSVPASEESLSTGVPILLGNPQALAGTHYLLSLYCLYWSLCYIVFF